MSFEEQLCARCNRRRFLQLGGLAAVGIVLAACGGSTANDAAESQIAAAAPDPTATASLSSEPTQSSAQPSGVACRTGIVKDPFPGHCRNYVDRNGNGYCDLSELGSGSISPRY